MQRESDPDDIRGLGIITQRFNEIALMERDGAGELFKRLGSQVEGRLREVNAVIRSNLRSSKCLNRRAGITAGDIEEPERLGSLIDKYTVEAAIRFAMK